MQTYIYKHQHICTDKSAYTDTDIRVQAHKKTINLLGRRGSEFAQIISKRNIKQTYEFGFTK
jgi:hypothetical protein